MSASRGGISVVLIIIVVVAAVLISSLSHIPSPNPEAQPVNMGQPSNQQPTKSLQLTSLIPATPAPASGNCSHDSGNTIVSGCHCQMYTITCANQKCTEAHDLNDGGVITCTTDFDGWCASSGLTQQQDGTYCLGKPVIYLYPTKTISVDVSVKTAGQVTVSDPLYPNGGWKGVIAQPGGILEYQGKKYSELFYETDLKDINPPKDGIVIQTVNLRSELDNIISKLGLIGAEKTEFLDWWIPRLTALDSPYLLFSVLDKPEKERTDRVNIQPKPDTMIEFIAYFKPLNEPTFPSPLTLPLSPPKRIGFTAVEWGGVIDSK